MLGQHRFDVSCTIQKPVLTTRTSKIKTQAPESWFILYALRGFINISISISIYLYIYIYLNIYIYFYIYIYLYPYPYPYLYLYLSFPT